MLAVVKTNHKPMCKFVLLKNVILAAEHQWSHADVSHLERTLKENAICSPNAAEHTFVKIVSYMQLNTQD